MRPRDRRRCSFCRAADIELLPAPYGRWRAADYWTGSDHVCSKKSRREEIPDIGIAIQRSISTANPTGIRGTYKGFLESLPAAAAEIAVE